MTNNITINVTDMKAGKSAGAVKKLLSGILSLRDSYMIQLENIIRIIDETISIIGAAKPAPSSSERKLFLLDLYFIN